MLAVTAVVPAVWLVTLISTVPSGSVITVGATVAPLPAITLTVCPASVLPLASVTFTCSVFAVEASATQLSRVTTRSAIFAVLTSAINVTFQLWLLLLMLAVTTVVPAVWLVTPDFHRAVRLRGDRRSDRCAVACRHADRLPGKRITERIGDPRPQHIRHCTVCH